MEAAHIIPFSLNKFDETNDLVIRVVFFACCSWCSEGDRQVWCHRSRLKATGPRAAGCGWDELRGQACSRPSYPETDWVRWYREYRHMYSSESLDSGYDRFTNQDLRSAQCCAVLGVHPCLITGKSTRLLILQCASSYSVHYANTRYVTIS
jgi:hypothetical protein